MFKPIRGRSWVAFLHDVVMAAVSFVVSLFLRFGDDLPFYFTATEIAQITVVFAVIAGIVFWSMGLYRGVWRYASLNDLLAITRSVTLAILAFLIVMFAWTRLDELPRSLPFINWFVLMALLGGPRFLYRVLKDRRFEFKLEQEGRHRIPVLLIGAGDGAEMFIRALSLPGSDNYQAVGILAETPGRLGRHIHGVEVLGMTGDLATVVRELDRQGERPQRLILTKDDLDGAVIRQLLEEAGTLGMTLARIPKLTDFRRQEGDAIEVRPVAVEDLLGRPQKPLDRQSMRRLIAGRRVLITGAGGSIGSELVRQVSEFGPSELLMLDSSEFNLYTIDLEMTDRAPGVKRRKVLADIRDHRRIDTVFADFKPELVFHAAALKHVPMVEENPFEGVMTNIIGTVNVADACRAAGVAAMVQISTDKAVNPTNVMGATKRVAESYAQALDLERGGTDGTRFVTVRFGNVLGSTGSVVPLFQQQLARGGPLTVTHPDMERYFMTIHEAVELILLASAMGSTGHQQDGKIFVLDMGEPVRILDLAQQMIRLAGKEPDIDIKIEITGSRPGEKLFEEIFHGAEPPVPTGLDGILLAAPRGVDLADLTDAIDRLADACHSADSETMGLILGTLVPEYGDDTGAA